MVHGADSWENVLDCIVYLVLSFLCQSPGPVIVVSRQGQMTDIKVLERGDCD